MTRSDEFGQKFKPLLAGVPPPEMRDTMFVAGENANTANTFL